MNFDGYNASDVRDYVLSKYNKNDEAFKQECIRRAKILIKNFTEIIKEEYNYRGKHIFEDLTTEDTEKLIEFYTIRTLKELTDIMRDHPDISDLSERVCNASFDSRDRTCRITIACGEDIDDQSNTYRIEVYYRFLNICLDPDFIYMIRKLIGWIYYLYIFTIDKEADRDIPDIYDISENSDKKNERLMKRANKKNYEIAENLLNAIFDRLMKMDADSVMRVMKLHSSDFIDDFSKKTLRILWDMYDAIATTYASCFYSQSNLCKHLFDEHKSKFRVEIIQYSYSPYDTIDEKGYRTCLAPYIWFVLVPETYRLTPKIVKRVVEENLDFIKDGDAKYKICYISSGIADNDETLHYLDYMQSIDYNIDFNNILNDIYQKMQEMTMPIISE